MTRDEGLRSTPQAHVCVRIKYVAEGEAVCFECGALYVYARTLDEESLAEYRKEVTGG